MSYVINTPIAGSQPIAERNTTQRHALGTIVRASDPTYGEGEFKYLKGVASCVLGSWVSYKDEDGTTALLAANAIGPVAVAMAATTASFYGWFQISGTAVGKCLTQMASNTRVWITGTAGSVDDASVAGDGINLAKSAALTVVGSLVTTFEIQRPYVTDRTSFS
jgi:hypothetical protein